MAGKGTRLQNFDSYPKPLVKILGKTIVEWSIDTLGLEGNFIFCCKKEHIEKLAIEVSNSLKGSFKGNPIKFDTNSAKEILKKQIL